MMRLTGVLMLLFSCCSLKLAAQTDTLPRFTVVKRNGIVTVSWINAYKNVAQINVQRSKDSNRNFVTIHSTPNPQAKSYAYTDNTAKNDSGYYRVFILFEGSNYTFTRPRRATEVQIKLTEANPSKTVDPEPDHSLTPVGGADGRGQKNKQEKLPNAPSTTPVKKVWEPSVYVFTGNDGNVVIRLPDAASKSYSLTIVREEGRPVFVLADVKESFLTLDKASFLKSGWYYFELKESGNLVERNKFLVTRDY